MNFEMETSSSNVDNYSNALKQPGLKKLLADYMPDEKSVNTFITNALRFKSQQPLLARCTAKSINSCLLAIAEYGLSLSLQEVYLIPYGNDLTLQLGYKGLVTLAYQSGEVKAIHAETVHEGDDFKVIQGTESSLSHSPSFATQKDSSNMLAVYCIIELKSGGKLIKVMSKGEIDAHRAKFSKSRGRSNPWETSFLAMSQKTVLKQLLKLCPKSMRSSTDFPEEMPKEPEGETIEGVAEQENVLGFA